MKRLLMTAAAVLLGLFPLVIPAQAQAEPTGCTTSVQWVQQGNNYFQGKGNVTCATGSYEAKLECWNEQTGGVYVKYGTQVADAPGTASAICDTGNVAEKVAAVAEPPGTGVTGCMSWTQWVYTGYNSGYLGLGVVQCDTGTYQVMIDCHNMQTGYDYVLYGSEATAPASASGTCSNPYEAVTVTAVPA
jgi:hypothetical protein